MQISRPKVTPFPPPGHLKFLLTCILAGKEILRHIPVSPPQHAVGGPGTKQVNPPAIARTNPSLRKGKACSVTTGVAALRATAAHFCLVDPQQPSRGH